MSSVLPSAGHALRIFGGLADAKTAEQLVNQLFGGVQGGGQYRTAEYGFSGIGSGVGEFWSRVLCSTDL